MPAYVDYYFVVIETTDVYVVLHVRYFFTDL